MKSLAPNFDPGSLQSFSLISGFTGDTVLVERLKEMGFHQGQKLQYVGRAPFGGPYLFRLGATVLALRQEEAQCLILTKS